MLINLLEKKKENEYTLIKQFEHHVQFLPEAYDSTVRYAYCDINMNDKEGKYENTW
jgi:hypothetical protein